MEDALRAQQSLLPCLYVHMLVLASAWPRMKCPWNASLLALRALG